MSRSGRAQVCLFVGPSPAADAIGHIVAGWDAEVQLMAPIQQGDLLKLRDPRPSVVVIVDGAFFQVPAVSHKEILLTLEEGVRVLGSSSLGALRAAGVAEALDVIADFRSTNAQNALR